MQAALLPERGVVKVAGETARAFLNGIVSNDIGKVAGQAAFAALLTPQGKIVVDFIAIEASVEDGGGIFLDCPRALSGALVEKLRFYKLRAKVTIDDLSDALSVVAVWGAPGKSAETEYGLGYVDPRLPELGTRLLVPPEAAAEAAAELGATLVDAELYDAHRIALGVPRGGQDFIYSDTFPHEADMDQLAGVDFDKGCYIGQEVVSRVEHRAMARNRVVPVAYDGGAPAGGAEVTAAEKPVGVMGSAANGHGLALLRLDRVTDAIAGGMPLMAGGVELRIVKPKWADFAWPGEKTAT
jgi:tRNA-modifying protein YgfZ